MPRQERAERSRARILDAAADEFDAHGFSGARLERIVERTGLTKGAVYFHFRSKLDLAKALVSEKYANGPAIVAEVEESGLRGVAAATGSERRPAVDQRVLVREGVRERRPRADGVDLLQRLDRAGAAPGVRGAERLEQERNRGIA